MTALSPAFALFMLTAARAAAEAPAAFAPMRRAAGGAVPAGDGAMLWLALAAVAMIAALYAAHWSIFRRK